MACLGQKHEPPIVEIDPHDLARSLPASGRPRCGSPSPRWHSVSSGGRMTPATPTHTKPTVLRLPKFTAANCLTRSRIKQMAERPTAAAPTLPLAERTIADGSPGRPLRSERPVATAAAAQAAGDNGHYSGGQNLRLNSLPCTGADQRRSIIMTMQSSDAGLPSMAPTLKAAACSWNRAPSRGGLLAAMVPADPGSPYRPPPRRCAIARVPRSAVIAHARLARSTRRPWRH